MFIYTLPGQVKNEDKQKHLNVSDSQISYGLYRLCL